MSKDRKAKQLGMNPSTASGRLVKDTLWRLIETCDLNSCHRCGFPMTRETFSIEHIEPWLDSENPQDLFFNQENISFSHLSCNVADSRPRKPNMECGSSNKYQSGCRCDLCVEYNRSKQKRTYSPEKRSERYRLKGY